MNEKKKGFNLFPEYVWMIFVGMLLAILILTNVIPGHAGEVSPVAGSNSVAFSYESPDNPEYVYTCPFYSAVMVDSQGYYNWINPPASVYASDDYGVNYYSVINSTSFSNDVKLIKGSVGSEFSGTSLIHVSKANYTGYLPGSVQESWYEDFQEAGYTYFGCDLWAFPSDDISYQPECIGYMIIKFSDNEIPVLSKVNRVFNTELFQVDFDESKVVETLTFFNNKAWIVWGFDFPSDAYFWASGRQVIYDGLYDHSDENHRIYVKTVNRGDFYFNHVSYNEQYSLNYKYRANVECLDLHRDPDPEEPEPDYLFHFIFQTDRKLLSSSDNTGYYCVEVSGVYNPSVTVSESSAAYSYAYRLHNVVNPYITPVFCYGWDSDNVNAYAFYFGGSSVTYNVYYSSSPFASTDIDFIRSNFNAISSSSFSLYSSGGLSAITCRLSGYDNFNGYFFSSIPGFKTYGFQTINSTDPFYDTGLRDTSNLVGYPLVRAYIYGLSGASGDPVGPSPTPTVAPTSTPVPLPTSGESIHVILPTGTPTPTPPFTVSGGSDGGSGSGSGTGSPGSIGSGLSSGQTSGVLQAWQLYVSDNPAMIFLTSTFQALPQELLYPLYILLFILLLLAVIRLFVHFSGG